MLNLQEFKILLQEQNEYFYRFTVENKDEPLCVLDVVGLNRNLTEQTPNLRNIKSKKRTVSDLSMHRKAVKIVIVVKGTH